MGKTRSIRGEIVDFDILKVKQQMEKRDKPNDVEMREKYIDIKKRRNPRRSVSDLVKEQNRNELDVREKLRAAKEAKKLEQKDDSKDKEEKKPSPTATPTETKRTSRKKIVRSKKSED